MNWEERLKKKWYLHTTSIDNKLLSFTTCENEVIDFISQLLKEQREICAETYYEKYKIFPFGKETILNAPEPSGLKGDVE